jgi:hypothetical protein
MVTAPLLESVVDDFDVVAVGVEQKRGVREIASRSNSLTTVRHRRDRTRREMAKMFKNILVGYDG